MVELSYFIPKEDVTEELMARIRSGIAVSEFTPPWAVRYYNQNKDK